jgi:hypothetical protein
MKRSRVVLLQCDSDNMFASYTTFLVPEREPDGSLTISVNLKDSDPPPAVLNAVTHRRGQTGWPTSSRIPRWKWMIALLVASMQTHYSTASQNSIRSLRRRHDASDQRRLDVIGRSLSRLAFLASPAIPIRLGSVMLSLHHAGFRVSLRRLAERLDGGTGGRALLNFSLSAWPTVRSVDCWIPSRV